MQLQATSGNITSIKFSPSSTQVGASTVQTIQWQCDHIVPAGSTFKIAMPKWNPSASILKSYIQGQVTCNTVAVLSNDLQCAFVNDTLIVSNAVNATIGPLTTLAVSVIGFKNPIDTALVTGFIITSMAGNYAIDSGMGSMQVSDYAQIQQGSLALRFPDDALAGQILHSDMMKLQFALPVPLNQGCKVTVQLPYQYNVSTVTLVGALQVFGDYQQFTSLNKNYTDNSFTIYPCRTYIDNTNLAVLYISNLTQYRYEKATDSVRVKIQSSTGEKIAQVQSGITFTPYRGSIRVAAQAIVQTVQTPTQVQLQIQPQHKIFINDQPKIVLSFPLKVQTPCQTSIGTCVIVNQTIIISSWLMQDYSPQQGPINLTIGTVVNPQSTEQITGFDVLIAAFGQYAIDEFEGRIPWQLGPGSMSQVLIDPQSYVAYSAENTYSFTFQPAHTIPLNSYITIVIPIQIQIPDLSYSQSSCQSQLGFPQQPICSITSFQNQTTLQIMNAFRTMQGEVQLYQLSVPGFTNPITQNPTDSFIFSTYTQDGYLIDQFTGGNIQMLQSAEITSVTVKPTSFQNSAVATYYFTVTPSVPVLNTHSIVVQLPDQITANNPVCNATTIAIASVQCSQTGQSIRLRLTLVAVINAGDLISFSISGLTNPPTTQTTDSFIIKIVDQFSQTTNQRLFNVTLTMISPSPLLEANISATLYQPGILTQYILTFVPVHAISIGGGVMITVPPQIQVQNSNISVKVKTQNQFVTPNLNVEPSARALYIDNIIQSSLAAGQIVTIYIDGLSTPFTDKPTDSFKITTYNLINNFYYLIDQADQGLFIRAACSYPCNTCPNNSTSTCLSCYSDSVLPLKQLGTCVSECNFGRFYNQKTSQCELCDSKCLTCAGTAEFCLTCANQNYPFFYQNQCLSYCPEGFIPDIPSNRCLPCINDCLTCSKTQSTCTSCDKASSRPFLLKNRCLENCTKDISVTVNDTCVLCDSNCKTCKRSPKQCTSCEQHMKFDPLGQLCEAECLPQTQIYNPELEQCDTCNSTCTTCQGDINKCSACKPSYVLNKDFSCQTTCNSVTQTAVKGICMNCDEPCYSCNGTTKTCTSCLQSPTKYYLFQKSQCLQYCPAKYNVSADGLECVFIGLICPTNFVPDSSGNGCIPIIKECVTGYELNDDLTACVPVPGSPVPFPFLIAAVFVSFLVLGSFLKEKFFTKVYSCLLAIIGSFEIIMYALMVALSGYAGEAAICGLSAIGFVCLIISNIVFIVLFQREVVAKDEEFAKWLFFHPKTKVFVPICCLVFNFKSSKIIYSGFYGLESSQAKFSKPLEYYRIVRMCSYFSFIFSYGFIFVADLIIFAKIKWGYQLLVLGIETFILQILIIVLSWLESKKPPEELLQVGTSQYTSITPGSKGKEVKVKAGADELSDNYEEGVPDVDESLFIRSQDQQKQKEMSLRLQAFSRIIQQVKLNNSESIMQCYSRFKTSRRFSESILKQDWSTETDSIRQERRYSWPSHQLVQQSDKFKQQIDDMIEADAQYQIDNCYFELKKVHAVDLPRPKKQIQKRTQTYLKDLLHLDGYDQINESERSIVVDDDAEIDENFTNIMLKNVIDKMSGNEQSEDFNENHLPEEKLDFSFDVQDIMGEFEIDDLGNFIIIRAQDQLIDKFGRIVNRRGYLIDVHGNVINNQGVVVYKHFELDNDDEIPVPFDHKPVVVQGRAAVEQEVIPTVTPEQSVHEAQKQEESVIEEFEEEIPQVKVKRRVKKVKQQLIDNLPPKRVTDHQLYPMITIDNEKQVRLAALADSISDRTHRLALNKSIQTLVINQSQYLDDRIQQRPEGGLQKQRPQTGNVRLKNAYAQGTELSKIKSQRAGVVTQELRPASSIQNYSRLELQRISEIYMNQTLQVKVPQKVMGPFRPMMHQLLDDPEELNIDTEMDGVRFKTKDVSIAMADRVDQIQRQYLKQTAWRAATTITRPDSAVHDNWIQ